MKAATGKERTATSTAEAPLPQPEDGDNDDEDDVITPSPELKEERKAICKSHKEAHSGNKPTGTKLKTMAELDAEEKRAAERKKDESQGVGKAEAILEQRLAEETHDAYYLDINKEYEKSFDKERYAEQCFRLRADKPYKNFTERFNYFLWQRERKITNESYDAQLNKEMRINKNCGFQQQFKELYDPLSPAPHPESPRAAHAPDLERRRPADMARETRDGFHERAARRR